MAKAHKCINIVIRVLLMAVFGYFIFRAVGIYNFPTQNFFRIFLDGPVYVLFCIWNVVCILLLLFNKRAKAFRWIGGIICVALFMIVSGMGVYWDEVLPYKSGVNMPSKQIMRAVETAVYGNARMEESYTSSENIHLGKIILEKGDMEFHSPNSDQNLQVSISYAEHSPKLIRDMLLEGSKKDMMRYMYYDRQGVLQEDISQNGETDAVQYDYRIIKDEGMAYIVIEDTDADICYYLQVSVNDTTELNVERIIDCLASCAKA